VAGKDLNRLSQIHPIRACVTVPIVLRVTQRVASLIDETADSSESRVTDSETRDQ
jgi:hypothetical protein